MLLDALTILYIAAAFGMSAALTTTYPKYAGWGNVSRSNAWPVTLYEVFTDKMD